MRKNTAKAYGSSDAEVVEQVLLGDTELFGVLFERYAKKIFGYLWHFSKQREDCEDFLQDTFYKAYVNLKYCRDRERFSSWLFAIAHNVAVSNSKKLSLYVSRELGGEQFATLKNTPSAEDINLALVREEDAGNLRKIISEMPPAYKDVTLLFYYSEFTLREVSETLNIPVNTVKSRLHRSRHYLGEKLAGASLKNNLEFSLVKTHSS